MKVREITKVPENVYFSNITITNSRRSTITTKNIFILENKL